MSVYCTIDADCGDGYICVGGRCVPEDIGENPPPAQLPGLGVFLRRRYTSNVAISEQMSANDFLHDVLFPAARMYITQDENGKISFKNKKPVPYAFTTAAIAIEDDVLAIDDVSPWIGDVNNWVVISPHTNKSEVRAPVDAYYSTGQNSVTLTSGSSDLDITAFAGCDGVSTPATAEILVKSVTPAVAVEVVLNGIAFTFTPSASDTVASVASYITGVIASHPSLWRKFDVEFDGTDNVILTGRFGFIEVAPVAFAKGAPLADPVTAPTLTAAGSGALAAGIYAVAYSAVNSEGETLLSEFKLVTLTANQKINVSTVSLPGGATSLKWYCSPEAGSVKLRYIAENNGVAFSINALPLLSAPLPPDLNRTGAEVMRVAAVFSDREESRSAASRSNVIVASFEWLLGNREKTVNRIDLKYRNAAEDWRLIELRLRDDASIAKTKKISNMEVNGQAIDNTDQAYRITSGLLAEKQDADFFYKWSATRAALLLQEGDVVAITDNGSGVINFPVIIEQIEFDIPSGSMPRASFTGRKYASNLYDDSVAELAIPIITVDTSPTGLAAEAISDTEIGLTWD